MINKKEEQSRIYSLYLNYFEIKITEEESKILK